MKHFELHLKEQFSFLGENGSDPILTAYLPFNMNEMPRQHQKRPTLLICPGGGYSIVSQREAEVVGLHFLPQGFNVFVLNYSVAPHRFPTQIREVAAATELIHQNAEEWNVDTERVAIMGFSAGGHLAAHYSVAFDCAEVRAVLPESKPVNATVLGYPVITAEPEISHSGSFKNLLGVEELTPEQIEKFSCDRHVRDTTAPTFLWHTAEDGCVSVQNTLLYAQKLAQHKVPFEVHIYPFGCHGLSTCDHQVVDNLTVEIQYDSAWLSDVKKWFDYIWPFRRTKD